MSERYAALSSGFQPQRTAVAVVAGRQPAPPAAVRTSALAVVLEASGAVEEKSGAASVTGSAGAAFTAVATKGAARNATVGTAGGAVTASGSEGAGRLAVVSGGGGVASLAVSARSAAVPTLSGGPLSLEVSGAKTAFRALLAVTAGGSLEVVGQEGAARQVVVSGAGVVAAAGFESAELPLGLFISSGGSVAAEGVREEAAVGPSGAAVITGAGSLSLEGAADRATALTVTGAGSIALETESVGGVPVVVVEPAPGGSWVGGAYGIGPRRRRALQRREGAADVTGAGRVLARGRKGALSLVEITAPAGDASADGYPVKYPPRAELALLIDFALQEAA